MKNILLRYFCIFTGLSLSIGLMSYLSDVEKLPVLIAPLAASACLIFVLPDGKLAQPKNVILGHVFSALVGCVFFRVFGNDWLSAAFATATAVLVMDLSNTMHPPAAATCVIAVTIGHSFGFAIAPVGLGATLLVVTGVLLHAIFKDCDYPSKQRS